MDKDATVRAAKAALLNTMAIAVLAAAQPAVCHPTRAQIMRALGVGPLDVTDLTRILDRRRTVISQHLRVLRTAGLVEARRQGRSIYYRHTSIHAVQVALTALEAAARVGS